MATRHPDLFIQELIFMYKSRQEKFLLQRLDTFKGLTRLTLEIPCFDQEPTTTEFSTEAIVDLINCPQLEHLTILRAADCKANLREKFPNLISFDVSVHHIRNDIFFLTDTFWDTFYSMMEQSIHFRVRVQSCQCDNWSQYSSSFSLFHSNLQQYAAQQGLDPTPLIHRLAATTCFFKNHLGEHGGRDGSLYIDLREYPECTSQDLQVEKVSEVIRSVIFPGYKPTTLSIKLYSYDHDTNNKDAHLLLANDRRFEASLDTEITYRVISECLPFLSNIRHINFQMQSSTINDQRWHPKMKTWLFKIGKRYVSIELLMHYHSGNNGYSDYGAVKLYRRQENKLDEEDEIQIVLKDYFNLVPTLDSIEISAQLKFIYLSRN